MKKSIVLISTALVFGAILQGRAENEVIQNPADWFTGIGVNATGKNPDPTGAAWDFTAVTHGGTYEIDENKALKLSLQEGDYVTLTPGDAPDTNTVTTLDVTTVISAVEELPTMTEDPAQTALVVNGGKYWAWNGTVWVELVGTPTREPVALKVELSYADMKESPARAAFFTIGNGTRQEVTLTGAAQSAGRLTRVTCSGMTTITNINGKVELGYAKNDEVKYPTVAAALAAAKADGSTNDTVVLLRDTDEQIVMDSSVKIDTAGKETGEITLDNQDPNAKIEVAYGNAGESTASGQVEVPLNTGVTIEKIDVVVEDASKEVKAGTKTIANNKLTFTVWTKSSIVTNTAPTGAKALSANETKLRAFLEAKNIEAYTAANTSSEAIANALQAKGENNLELWKSYVMGIEPTDSVKPVSDPSADSSTTAVTLKVPAFADIASKKSGDYNVMYKIDNGDAQTVTGQDISIQLPTVPTDYTVKIVLH